MNPSEEARARMSFNSRRLLSVVVIGLNEQDRLKQSLGAVFDYRPEGWELEVFYVDSGSTDRSVEIAGAVPGVEVLHLNGTQHSAAIARNVGLRRARGEYVQLIDGDSVVQPGWMETALGALARAPEVACVFGQCIEMNPDQSVYMKLCSFDWYIPPGDRRTCGGNSMWRLSVISTHGFFNETIRFGEEPDLCYRVRHSGGRILCIDAPMVKHDLGMRHFGQYWNRAVNSGQGYAEVAARFWRNREKLWLRESVLNFAEPAVWLLTFLAGALLAGMWGGAALLLAWWAIRATQIAFGVRRRRLPARDAFLYGLHCQFVRLPAAIGQFKTILGFR